MPITITDVLETLAAGKSLDADAAAFAFEKLMDGDLSPSQAGALLMGLRAKGETALEIAAAVKAVLDRARLVKNLPEKRFDPVGTGGDKSCSFNCSTATSLAIAGMGYAVVKHGNRAITSSCGAADAIEGLGLPMLKEPEDIAAEVKKRGFAFLFAPHFHPAFKHIMPVRRELGMRTLFNLLGPLVNPARPTHQLVGVARPQILELVAETLLLTGIKRAAVVYGQGGLDELTPFGPAEVVWVGDGKTVRAALDPAELGIAPCAMEDIVVRDKAHALEVLRELLGGKGPKAMREMLVLNMAVALHLLDEGPGLQECVEKARAGLASGAGLKLVESITG
jgi:anthranilate phosphoribosyltransferase